MKKKLGCMDETNPKPVKNDDLPPGVYYVGSKKPVIQHITNEEPLSYTSEQEAKTAEGDYNRIDNGF